MRPHHTQHPDLTIPLLPDADDLPLPPRPFDHDMNLRGHVDGPGGDSGDDWPEAGPSGESKGKGKGMDKGMFGAKAVAAMTGAMATSLLMTPFDVLKTRLQTVPPHPTPDPATAAAAAECCQKTVIDVGAHKRPSAARIPPANANAPSPAGWGGAAAAGNESLTCYSSATSSSTTSTMSSSSSSSSAGTSRMAYASFRPAAAPTPAPSGCLNPSKWAGIWGEPITFESLRSGGGGFGAGAGVLTLPREAVIVQPETGGRAVPGFWSELAAVRRETGVRGLWKGVGTGITMGIPSSAIYMLGYEQLSLIISPYFLSPEDPLDRPAANGNGARSLTASLTPAPLIAGSLARTLSATVISPIEMFRTRLQALPSPEGISPTYRSVTTDMYKLVQNKGVAILYRGLGPTLWRDVPFSGIYWAGFETLKTLFSSPSSPLPPLAPIPTSFLAGFLSGTFSALLTQPFDVLKTRRQVFNPSPGCTTTRASTLPLAWHVVKTEGWGALYAGTSARCGKVAPACGLMIACYEGVGRFLGGQEA
ncbi:hypothetical protein IAT38_007310 [Cryptococcus sp. DSM 104549]